METLRNRRRSSSSVIMLGAAALMLGLAACTQAGQPEGQLADAAPTTSGSTAVEEAVAAVVGQSEVPMVSAADACVAPEDIYFDTFRGGAIQLSEASESDILRLRDVIPPIDNPNYDDVSGGDWMRPDDLVLGYADGGEAFGYPIKILNFHEIVNDTINNRPVLISYCPLCLSGLVFNRILDGQELTFGNTSALYESDMVMYDHQTGSYWHQVGGQGIVGSLCEQRLELLPSITTTWSQWKELHPDTLVLSLDTGFQRPYQQDSFSNYPDVLNSGRFAFPVSERGRDPRLGPADVVLAAELGDERRGYSLAELGDAVVQDTLGGQNIVIFSSAAGPSGAAYVAEAGGEQLTFTYEDGQYVDEQTGSIWKLSGEAVDGSLAGSVLEAVPARYTFWFAIVATYPDIQLYAP